MNYRAGDDDIITINTFISTSKTPIKTKFDKMAD